ncbi:MAG: amidohydrolase family protein [Gemmatimonadetes bacterium]|nr:amidohydrolase family protein [Gemmatimonadota bacterium]
MSKSQAALRAALLVLPALQVVSSVPVLAQTAQVRPAPARAEGDGPFERLIIRGATVIDGTGAPPQGPVDIVIEGNRIARIAGVGVPGRPIQPDRRPAGATREIQAEGMYVLPGFVDNHLHTGDPQKTPEAEYIYKLWMAHGITAGRGVDYGPYAFTMSERARSAKNEITAPRMFVYLRPGQGWDQGPVRTPDQARAWVRWIAQNGADGMKLGAHSPAIMKALLEEAKVQGLGSTAHLAQIGVAQMNALDAARLGLGTVTHFYGLFEALYSGSDVQPWPVDMNYNDEQHRFGQVARQWNLIHPPGSPEWKALLNELKELGTVLDPTMVAYLASRDVMRMRNADWHATYTLPSLWDFYTPSRDNHGSYYFDWTPWDEIAWKNFYRVWMQLLNDYKNMGGRVTVSSDAGFIYNLFGFGTIQEMELLQEAGFHPLEIIRGATMHAAQALYEPKGREPEFGIVREGMLADLVVVGENPIANIKVLYGTGHVRLNDETGISERVGGILYTIKDGIVYDAKQLLADVARMVARQKAERGITSFER